MILKAKKRLLYGVAVILAVVLLFPFWGGIFLPAKPFARPLSTVVYDRRGQLLGAHIAADGQWRFPPPDSLPEKYKQALIIFEDRYFYIHPGVNPFALIQAAVDNVKAGKIVRGGSTLTMQVIRLMRRGKKRSVGEKIIEILLATALERKYSKEEILRLYAAQAPFGGNVVGIEAASWRWFGHAPGKLTWAEAATLAVLPNAPALIHPGKNRIKLLSKRNKLLKKLMERGFLDSLQYRLALLENIPEKPGSLPRVAPHLTDRFHKKTGGKKVITTIDKRLQQQVNRIVSGYYKKYSANDIKNMAVLVLKTGTKEVLAYVGNTGNGVVTVDGKAVDMIRANRSTGSILKPLLYAAAIDDGLILLNTLLPDIPGYFKDYHPQNFDKTFEGAVPAARALSRSRNVPAVYLLRDYHPARFLDLLHRTGIDGFDKPADYYGLTMILGGGEASLWDITSMYAGMSQTLLNYYRFYGKYTGREYDKPVLELKKVKKITEPEISQTIPVHAGAVWETWHALYTVHRPPQEEGWEFFPERNNIAWKTGTSFGFRDAWAVGSTADYVVGVWVGNADGEGRFGLTGVSSAAPVMFDVFHKLKPKHRFHRPEDEMVRVTVCKKSGYIASSNCPDVDTVLVYKSGMRTRQCPFHVKIYTDEQERYRVYRDCFPESKMKAVSLFVLPPVQEWYYRKTHPGYKTLPPEAPGCKHADEHPMQFVYPHNGDKIFVPKGAGGKPLNVLFELTHHRPEETVFWHLDQQYLGFTKSLHQWSMVPPAGKHTLTVVDAEGHRLSVRFEVMR